MRCERRANDYLIDRELQASGQSFTGMKGLGTQDCAIQESMGPISDRTAEHLLASDAAIVKIRRLLLQTLRDLEDGKALPAWNAASYRVRSTRVRSCKGAGFRAQHERTRARGLASYGEIILTRIATDLSQNSGAQSAAMLRISLPPQPYHSPCRCK
jgi:hypothetical protein